MGAPPPAFTIRHADYAMSDNVIPFRHYDYFGPLRDPVPVYNSMQTFEEWTTNERITFEQLEEYGAYYVGERSNMYAVSHFVYNVEGECMPVFRKITGYDMFTDSRRMRIMRNKNRRGYAIQRAFPRPVCLNPPPPPNSQDQPKTLEFVINSEGVKINPNATAPADGTDNMEEDSNEKEEMKPMEEEVCFRPDEIIGDYFSDNASSSESPDFDNN